MCLGVVAILLLNVMDVFSVGGVALLDRPCMVFRILCVLCLWSQCASKCSFYRFVCVFVCRKLSPHFWVWEMDHMCLLSLCCFFVWFSILCGRVEPAVAVHLSLWYVVLIYHQYDVCKNYVVSKRHNLQAVELSQRSQTAVQIVSNIPAPIYTYIHMYGHHIAGKTLYGSSLTSASDTEPICNLIGKQPQTYPPPKHNPSIYF